MSAKLQLSDLAGMILEAADTRKLEQIIYEGRTGRPKRFSAVFRCAKKPCPARHAEIIILSQLMGSASCKEYVDFLRSQFPSMHLRYPKGNKAHWWINENDYVLLKVMFGG